MTVQDEKEYILICLLLLFSPDLLDLNDRYYSYCMFNKSCSIFIVYSLYKYVQDFLDIQ